MLPVAAAALPTSGNRAFGAQRATHIHNGVDLPAKRGTVVRAAAAGTVTHASNAWQPGFTGYGRHVVLRHPDGTWTLYAHLQQASAAVGQQVAEGEPIGTVGSSAFTREGGFQNDSGGPHLHFEVSPRPYPQSNAQRRIDPVSWLRGTPMSTMAERLNNAIVSLAIANPRDARAQHLNNKWQDWFQGERRLIADSAFLSHPFLAAAWRDYASVYQTAAVKTARTPPPASIEPSLWMQIGEQAARDVTALKETAQAAANAAGDFLGGPVLTALLLFGVAWLLLGRSKQGSGVNAEVL